MSLSSELDLGETLKQILTQYPSPRQIGKDREYYKINDDRDLHDLIRQKSKQAVQNVLETTDREYNVSPTLGQGTMGDIPYIPIERPDETTTTQKGIYIVYLFDTDADRLYLTLNQGATEAQRCSYRVGRKPFSNTILERHAARYRKLISPPEGFQPTKATITSTLEYEGVKEDVNRADAYNSGAILTKSYSPEDLTDEEQVKADLLALIDTYEDLLDQLYSSPQYDLEERNVWRVSPVTDQHWEFWHRENVASIANSQSGGIPPELESGDLIIAGTTITKIDVPFGIGRVTSPQISTDELESQHENPETLADEQLIGVDWYPFGDKGIAMNCLSSETNLFEDRPDDGQAQPAIAHLPAELGHFLGATVRRLVTTELATDFESELTQIESHLQFTDTGDSVKTEQKPLTETTKSETSTKQSTNPTVYQVPIETGQNSIRTDYQRTVLDGVPREPLEDITEIPIGHDELCIWWDREDDPADVGDYLLFADRDNRRSCQYTLLARVAHATILEPEAAMAFTDAIGWGDTTDATFHHILFLEPVYEADLDREQFWDTLGFSGWPNDTHSAINFDRNGSSFHNEYDSVNHFIESIKGQQIYPSANIDEYDSVDQAVEDIGNRLPDNNRSWLKGRISEAVIEDWSEALTRFEPSQQVTHETAAKLDQLRLVYETLETGLAAQAEKLGTGTLGSLPSEQTLFLGWIRLIQNESTISGGYLTQQKLDSILNKSYSTADSDATLDTDHPLITHLQETKPTVYKTTAPPEYWLTAIEYGSISFEDRHENRWNGVEKGDVAILHSRAEPSDPALGNQPAGIIGVGIFGEKHEKDEPWWWDEHEDNKAFSMISNFDRIFLTGDLTQINTTRGITEKDPSTIKQEIAALTTNCLPIEEANQLCKNATGKSFPAQSMYGTFRTPDDEIDYKRPTALIEAMANDLAEVSTINPHKPFQSTLPDHILEDLHFQNNIATQILEQISTALRSNKHILLTGPPGTGKTEIAERVCEHLADDHPYLYTDFEMTTATADWSTFDTVGGYMPNESTDNDQDLSFTPGIVLNRLKDRQTNLQSNDLLIVDELNRADIDKAFGQLFTLLSGQSVQLPYTVNDHEIELTTHKDADNKTSAHQYVVPNSWRIFATMNAYDKTSLYEMSYAFMRRFAFIRVPAPDLEATIETDDPAAELVHEYADVWDLEITQQEAQAVGRVWRKTNTAVDERAIGPAIIKDVLQYVTLHTDDLEYHLTQAVISYIFPQLEGVPKRKTIVRELTNVPDLESDLLESAAQEMLQVTLTANE
jgi:5-methylcytosine-specific restriction enzyme B